MTFWHGGRYPVAGILTPQPMARVEPDPDSFLGTSFRCRSARVLRRYSLSNAERSARAAAVGGQLLAVVKETTR